MNFKNTFLTIVFSILTFISITAQAVDSNGKVIIIPLSGFDSTAAATPVGGNYKKTVGEQRLEVFNHAAFLWSTILDLDYDITIEVNFSPLECTGSSATLGYAGPNRVKKISNVWYSTAQANQILKADTSSTFNDIYANFNSSIDNGCYNGSPDGWYYGIDNIEPANQEALLDVVLHEIGHGLGFLSFVDGGTGALFNSYIDSYSKNLYDTGLSKNWADMDDTERLYSNNHETLAWDGVNGTADVVTQGITVGIINGSIKMHAPTAFNSGSSVSHISTVVSPNQLMEPYNTIDGVYPSLEIAMFKDIGYKLKSELTGNNIPVAKSYSVNVPVNGSTALNYSNQTEEYDADTVFFLKYTSEPANGTIDDMYSGFATYTPTPGFSGTDTVKWKVYDSKMTVSNEGTITFVVGDVNTNPTAEDDSYDVTSYVYAYLGVSLNDTDSDGTIDSSSLAVVSQPTHGTVDVSGTSFRYLSNNGYTGADSFTYTVSDNDSGVSNTATVYLTVHARDVRAVVVNDTFSFDSNSVNSLASVVNNDSDSDLTSSLISRMSITSLPSNGSVSLVSGVPHYTPNANYVGPDSLTYKITGEGYTPWDSLDATISITVVSSNSAPVAVNDSFSVIEDTLSYLMPLANDTDDSAFDPSLITVISGPSNGSMIRVGDTFNYTPNLNFNGSDSFTYTIADSEGAISSVATSSITISAVNDAPVAVADSLTVDEDTSGNVTVLANDTDVDGDSLSYLNISISQPSNGLVVVDGNTLKYTPDADYSGSDPFSYTVTDGALTSNSVTVSVTVTSVIDPATTSSFNISIIEDATTVTESLSSHFGVGDRAFASFNIIDTPLNGTASIVGTDIKYTPNSNFNGSDTVSFIATDIDGLTSNTSVLTITVTPVNDAPIAIADSFSVTRSATSINLVGNDSDDEDSTSALSVVVQSNPSNGVLSVTGSNVSYLVNNSSAATSDSFTYLVTDSDGVDSNIVNVNLSIVSAQAPVSNLDVYSVLEDGSVLMPVTENDNTDRTFASVSVSVAPLHGVTTVSGLNITYTPDSDFSGQDSFTYIVTDNLGLASNPSAVTVNVSEVNDAPVAVADVLTATHATQTDLKVILNDTDENIGTSHVVVVSAPTHGTYSIVGSVIKYTSNGLFNYSSDSLTYKTVDSLGLSSNIVTVDINITHTIPTPVGHNDSYIVAANSTTSLHLLDNDTFGTNSSVINIISDVSSGTLYTYSDHVEYESLTAGNDSFSYTVSDELAQTSGVTTVNIVISNSVVVETTNDVVNVNEDHMVVIDAMNNDNITNFSSVSIISTPTKGSVIINGDNNFEYTPFGNVVGFDSFNYQVEDTAGVTATATVSVTIINDDSDFVTLEDTFTISEDSTSTLNVIFNDTVEGSNYRVLIKNSGSNGNVETQGVNSFDYTPNLNFNGEDSFTYSILNLDNNIESNTSTVNIVVSAVNDNPVAVEDVFYTRGGEYMELTVLNNDSDVDGDSLSIDVVTYPDEGTLSITGDSIFYEAAFNYEGTDTITYYISDSKGGQSEIVTVSIHVTEDTNTPITNPDDFTTPVVDNTDSSGAGGSTGLAFLISLLSLVLLFRKRD